MLELNKIAGQIDDMGRELAFRAGRDRQALPAARELLKLFADKQDRLRGVAESDDGRRLWCASPGIERLDLALAPSPLPEAVTVAAADGSQVFPDQHGLAFYYLINVGSILFRRGSGCAPEVATRPRLYYSEAEVYPGGRPVSTDLVSAERGVAEIRALADLLAAEKTRQHPESSAHQTVSPVALADGPLLLWLQWEGQPKERQEQILGEYLSALERLRLSDTAVAGFVSRPQSAEVVALLYLAHLEAEQRGAVRSLVETPFRGLTDRALFGFLRAGERSALFVRAARADEAFRSRGHSMHFFYINTGSDLARVEVPEWVARRGEQLALVQAAIYDQCLANNGYPYVLTRADEQAVISGDERQALEAMLMQAMVRHGLPLPELSRKARQKQVARWRRRR